MGLDTVELVMEIENEFDIKIDDRVASDITTVGQFLDVVLPLKPEADPQKAWLAIVAVTATQAGVPRERIKPDTSIIQDLHLD